MRTVMTQSGRTLGTITDAIIDVTDLKVSALVVRADDDRFTSILSRVRHNEAYVRLDAEAHVGPDWIVVPENAVISTQPEIETSRSRGIAHVRWHSATRQRVLAALAIIVLWIAGLEVLRPVFGGH